MDGQIKYYAFISYNSADEKWAKWLQHNLEYFHVPVALCKEYPNLPKKIRPVFWYKQDLSGTILKAALSKELEKSKYLIVICSPDSAKSPWVNDEVESFIKDGKDDKIIPFIVGGKTHANNLDKECFPPILLELKRDKEIRGIDVRRKEGKSHALVDVIATMFGIRFDELWGRHKRHRRRQLFLSILSFVVVFAICGAWRISVKNELITQAKFIAAEAEKLVENGDRFVSIKLLLNLIKMNKECLKDSDFNSTILKLGNDFVFPEKIYRNEVKISSVQFTPDGRYVLIESTDNISKLLLVESGECVKTFKYEHPKFSPDGKYVITSKSNNTTKIWLVENGECVQTFEHKSTVDLVQFSLDGKYVVTVESDNTTKIWLVENGECVQTFEHESTVDLVQFSLDGKYVVTVKSDNTVKVWSVENGECVRAFNHDASVNSVQFSPDRRYVATTSSNNSQIWSVESGECVCTFNHNAWVSSAQFSPDGKYVVTASWDNTSKIWSVESGECVCTFNHDVWVSSAQFSPDGKRVVTASWDNTSKIWSVESGECIWVFNHDAPVNSVQFSPDRRYVVTTSSNNSQIWSVESGECIRIYKHDNTLTSARFSPDGKFIATREFDFDNEISLNNSSRLWFLESGKCIKTSKYDNYNKWAQFSPDVTSILTVSSDNNVRIFPIKTVSEILDKWSDILGPNVELTKEEKEKYFLN